MLQSFISFREQTKAMYKQDKGGKYWINNWVRVLRAAIEHELARYEPLSELEYE